ncbi:hypothetical protein FQR65_LT07857 [Abscondita terminalis]|nr:hypothetical protein FQR65_LT07857 [Abscondita terminalis]
MKRPPGLWILLSAGVLCLSLQHVYGLKATELIFGKTTTTTTTTDASVDGESITEISQSENATKSNITGNPQIDYIYDPNLPRELNGYNLSSYPFYNSMPTDIDFKCDGLHDGFYASVPHKCQLYHHCLFGTRYDFLCANYTAFDQKTFICHFVSEVDCENSPKYWHRNDALYQAASTTTVKPTPISISPALTASPRPRPSPTMRRRRPSRRRPQYEYYDDDYEEDARDDYYEEPQPRRRRKRPRPRPRPIYDEYDDYEEERYERRGSGRRNENRRDEDRYDRRKDTYDRRDYEDRRRYKDDRRRDYDDDYDRNDRDRKKNDDRKRKPVDNDEDNPRYYENRKPVDETRYDRPKNNRKPFADRDDFEDDKRNDDRSRNPTGGDSGQPVVKPQGSSSIFNQPRMAPRIRPPVPKNEQNKYSYKPTTEAPIPKKSIKEEEYDDYEDDLPPPRPAARPKPEPEVRPERKPVKFNADRDDKRSNRRPSISETRNKPKRPVEEFFEDEEDVRPVAPKPRPKPDSYPRESVLNNRNRGKDLDDGRDELPNTKNVLKETRTENVENLRVTTSTKEPAREQADVVRVIKRPFLPSRGGNPFSNRGLQPVGAKALDIAQYDSETTSENSDERPTKLSKNLANESLNVQNGRQFPENKPNTDIDDSDDYYTSPPAKVKQQNKEETIQENKSEDLKPSPVLIKVVNRLRGTAIDTENKEDYKSSTRGSTRQPIKSKTVDEEEDKSIEKPSASPRNPLDIYDSEYDVTLNDALNPTIPNLPIRSFPTGFSPANDYTYENFNRPRNDVNYNSRQTETRFQLRSPSQKVETIINPYSNNGERKYVALPPGPIYSNFRPSPQITQAQSHGFYSVF